MATRPRLFASDLDGTLLGPDSQLSTETVAALVASRNAGVPVIAATGRGPRSAVSRLAPHGVIELAVCSNGAIVHDVLADRTVESSPIPTMMLIEFVAAITAHLPELACSWELDGAYGWHDGFDFIAGRHEDLRHLRRGDRLDHHVVASAPITKIMAFHPEMEPVALGEHLRSITNTELTIATSGVRFLELTGPGVTKAAALSRICDRLGIDAPDVVAYGDNQNDVAMLEWAGTGVAMGNAHPTAVAAANTQIGTNLEHSVATDMLERLTLPAR